MKRRIATIAAMLLLAVSLTAGAIGSNAGSAAAQDAVHEADGTWHRVSADGDPAVRFNVTWRGNINLQWSSQFRVTHGEGGSEVPARYRVQVFWQYYDQDGQLRIGQATKYTKGYRMRWTRFTLDDVRDYNFRLMALDASDQGMGAEQIITVRPRHVSPPHAPTNVRIVADDNGQGSTVKWDAPVGGGKPKHYGVTIVNQATGRTISDVVQMGNTQGRPSAQAKFAGLWPGDTYRVGVWTYARNSRHKSGSLSNYRWQKSERFGEATAALPSGATPSYAKKFPTLILWPVEAGEVAPPRMIGTPTAYVVGNPSPSIPGDIYQRFDAPNECRNWQNPHRFFVYRDQGAYKAMKAAVGQKQLVQNAREVLQAAKDAGRDSRVIAQKQADVDAAEAGLAEKVAKVGTECARAYPTVENLTDADARFYMTSITNDRETVSR